MQNAVRRKKKPILPVLLLAVIVAVAGGVFYFIDSRTPSKKHLSAQEYFGGSDASMAVTAGGEVTKDAAVVYDGATYISEDVIAERVDGRAGDGIQDVVFVLEIIIKDAARDIEALRDVLRGEGFPAALAEQGDPGGTDVVPDGFGHHFAHFLRVSWHNEN